MVKVFFGVVIHVVVVVVVVQILTGHNFGNEPIRKMMCKMKWTEPCCCCVMMLLYHKLLNML